MARRPDTVERILDGTLEAIARFGVGKLSMVDVAHEVGISRGTLYRYFATKDDLLLALGDHVLKAWSATLEAEVSRRPLLARRVEVVVEAIYDFSSRPVFSALLQIEPAFVRGFFRDHFAQFVRMLEVSLKPAVDAVGGASPVTPRLVAETIIRQMLSSELVELGPRKRAVRNQTLLAQTLLGLPSSGADGATANHVKAKRSPSAR